MGGSTASTWLVITIIDGESIAIIEGKRWTCPSGFHDRVVIATSGSLRSHRA